MNIIGDIAGRFDELMLLIQKMPSNEQIVLVGDLNDRGPKTKEVIQWCIDNNILSVKSNHGDMLIDHYNRYKGGNKYPSLYQYDIWCDPVNGGLETMLSYGDVNDIPEEHIKYLHNLPYWIETNEVFITHAPIPAKILSFDIELVKPLLTPDDMLWNRRPPIRRSKFQIFGHNSRYQQYNDKDGIYATCIDNTRACKLMGIHWPSMELFSQEYL